MVRRPAIPTRRSGRSWCELDTSVSPPQTGFLGFVRSGWSPPNIVWRITAQEGPCKLVVPETPFCNPACTGSAVCTEGGRCVAQPVARNAGRVRLRGLQTEIRRPGDQHDRDGRADGLSAAHRLAAGLPAVLARRPGGTGRRRRRRGRVLAVDPGHRPAGHSRQRNPDRSPRRRASPCAGRRPPAGATSVIQAVFDLSLHAGTKGKIECEVPDTGAHDVSASLMDKLLDLGTAGFPKVTVTRQSQASTAVASGRVRLAVLSEMLRELMIEGQISCTEDAECPSGRTCDLDKLLCKLSPAPTRRRCWPSRPRAPAGAASRPSAEARSRCCRANGRTPCARRAAAG